MWRSEAIAADSMIPNGSFKAPDLNPYSYDPDKAKALLEEAGYADGFEFEVTATPNESWGVPIVLLCIAGGILLGKIAPGVARSLDGMAISVNGAPVVSIPIAICLFFMMYPIMVKIDFTEVLKAGPKRLKNTQ